MEQLKVIWQSFTGFLAEYDSHKITEIFRDLDWHEVVHTPLVWLVGLPILGYLVWKRRFQTLLLIFSLIAFVALLLSVLPSAGQPIPLSKIVAFIGGSLALVLVNLYFLFVRG